MELADQKDVVQTRKYKIFKIQKKKKL